MLRCHPHLPPEGLPHALTPKASRNTASQEEVQSSREPRAFRVPKMPEAESRQQRAQAENPAAAKASQATRNDGRDCTLGGGGEDEEGTDCL